MDTGLRDAVVLVTGASSGIGQAAARAFGREGARVAITYHTNEALAEETAQQVLETGGESFVVRLDLEDAASINAAISAVAEHWGGIDVLVVNAVAWPQGRTGRDAPPFEDIASAHWQQTLRSTLEGAFHTIQAALPAMRGRDGGRIVLMSSAEVEYGMPGGSSYDAAKARLYGLCRSLARELGPAGILVNVVMPGLTQTERGIQMIPQFVRDEVAGMTPSHRLSDPDDIANAVVFLGSRANGNTSGEILKVSGGL